MTDLKNNLDVLWVQKGSFGYVVVKGKDSNPEWINRPFQVCSIFDKKNELELEQELQKTREQLDKADKVIEFYSKAFKLDDYSLGDDMEGDQLGRTWYGKRARQYFQDKDKQGVKMKNSLEEVKIDMNGERGDSNLDAVLKQVGKIEQLEQELLQVKKLSYKYYGESEQLKIEKKHLEQELQKTREQLNEHRTALKNLLFDETDNSHMEAENLLEKYKEQFKDKQGE